MLLCQLILQCLPQTNRLPMKNEQLNAHFAFLCPLFACFYALAIQTQEVKCRRGTDTQKICTTSILIPKDLLSGHMPEFPRSRCAQGRGEAKWAKRSWPKAAATGLWPVGHTVFSAKGNVCVQLFLSNFTLKDITIYINHKSWILPFGLRGVQSGGTEAFHFNRTTALRGAVNGHAPCSLAKLW